MPFVTSATLAEMAGGVEPNRALKILTMAPKKPMSTIFDQRSLHTSTSSAKPSSERCEIQTELHARLECPPSRC